MQNREEKGCRIGRRRDAEQGRGGVQNGEEKGCKIGRRREGE